MTCSLEKIILFRFSLLSKNVQTTGRDEGEEEEEAAACECKDETRAICETAAQSQ